MKLTIKTSTILIVVSFVITAIGALPMIINRDNSLLLPGFIVGNVLMIVGIMGIITNVLSKKKG